MHLPFYRSCREAHGTQCRMDVLCEFPDCVTSVVTATPHCQQDKTAVVKQSKQRPLTAAMTLWCDLQTGFLFHALAIL